MKKFGCVFLILCSIVITSCGEKLDPSFVFREQPLLQASDPAAVSLPHIDPSLVIVAGVELNFIDLPAVTEEEVRQLQRALDLRGRNERTAIVAMPAFRVAEAKTSIGLYFGVMGRYPDLSRVSLTEERAAEILRQWGENPDLPLIYTTVNEDSVFAERLSQITGRRFSIITNSQNEYSIRGRELDAHGLPTGAITSTKYYFGEVDEQVRNHAFIDSNPLTNGHAHGVHEIPEGADALYKNSFGLFHPIGNVWTRSIEGVVRGSAFNRFEWDAESSRSLGSLLNDRSANFGSRLVEILLDRPSYLYVSLL